MYEYIVIFFLQVYSCGVGIIDEQHCALFQIAANLQFISDRYIDNDYRPNAMTEEVARKKVTEILQYLDRYINLHFITGMRVLGGLILVSKPFLQPSIESKFGAF